MSRQWFLVTRSRGPNWDDSRRMEDHEGWRAHADFINALESEGFVVLGGPIVGTREVLLVFRARDVREIEERLRNDPWTRNGFLRTAKTHAWELRIGRLPEVDPALARSPKSGP